MYKNQFGKDPDISAIAQMLGNTLYGRRFFPFYTFNLLVGVNANGEGAMYGYDAIGSFERINTGSMGSAS